MSQVSKGSLPIFHLDLHVAIKVTDDQDLCHKSTLVFEGLEQSSDFYQSNISR